jgi:asparagine synthase (glutamine-hydrolysing)
MCGLLGWITASSEAMDGLDAERLTAGLAALAHRGPDGRGAVTFEGDGARGLLAHARLAIVDLSPAGAQPMTLAADPGAAVVPAGLTLSGVPAGHHALVFNGEIYNFRALRAELLADGVPAASLPDGDTAVLLTMLARWGVARTLPRLVGMFAFAFWDAARGALTLARDHLGVKPLYLRQTEHGLAFASEVRALVAAGLTGPLATRAAEVASWARAASCEDPQTLLPEVEQLNPGHWLTWRLTGTAAEVVRGRWWTPRRATVRPPRDRDEAVALIRPVLDAAVRDQLVADVPVAVFLSGGVDSAAIAAVAARHTKGHLEAVTLAFDAAGYDEDARAARVADHLGLRHHVVRVSPEEALAAVPEAFAAADLPSHDGVNTWLVARAARRRGLKVCLSGTGGDELFTGYAHAQRMSPLLLASRGLALLPNGPREAMARLAERSLERRGGAVRRLGRLAGLLRIEGSPEAYARLAREVFSPAAITGLTGATPPPPHAPTPAPEATLDDAGRLTVAELGGYLRDTQLRVVDAMSMAHGLEVRVPLLDHRLVAACLAIPARLKGPARLGGATVNKALLVAAAGLPPALLAAPKTGFTLPWELWLRGPLRAFAEDALLGPCPPLPLRQEAVLALWRAFLARPERHLTTRVLGLMALRLWARRTLR